MKNVGSSISYESPSRLSKPNQRRYRILRLLLHHNLLSERNVLIFSRSCNVEKLIS